MALKKTTRILPFLFISIILAITYLPILSLVAFSFNEGKSLTRWSGFSFQWYLKLFESREIMRAVGTTIVIAVISTVIATILGTLAAIALSKSRKVLRELTLSANNVPIVNPEIVTAIAFFVLFGTFAIERGYGTMLLAHIAFSTPYVVITVYPKVKSLDPNLADAAYDLGATPLQALFKVILPQIKVAIIAGAAIAFTMSFDDFVISYFAVSGSAVKNISIYLYTLKRGVEPTINALSTLIILVIGIKITYDYIKSGKKKLED
ncbi:MAG: ABC transporter permease [Acholeplasmataceae bacterium]|nr:ABC transporter permease [Acholeplasmataceae bacterium]